MKIILVWVGMASILPASTLLLMWIYEVLK